MTNSTALNAMDLTYHLQIGSLDIEIDHVPVPKAIPMNAEDVAAARVRAAINSGQDDLISEGRLLPERDLMNVLGISRRALRKILAALELEGLLFRRQGQGTFTHPAARSAGYIETIVNRTSPDEILEARKEIEPALARLAALRASPHDIEALRRIISRGYASTNPKDLERWDRSFHAKLASSIRNGLFYKLYEMLDAVRAETGWVHFRDRTFTSFNAAEIAAQHTAIVDALECRNPSLAESAMRTHLDSISSRLAS